MAPTPEELALGAKAYREVRSIESSFLYRYQLLLIVLVGIVITGILLYIRQRLLPHSVVYMTMAPLLVFVLFINHLKQQENLATQKLLLHLLEEKYGDVLPWVLEEKQLAEARALEAKVAALQ